MDTERCWGYPEQDGSHLRVTFRRCCKLQMSSLRDSLEGVWLSTAKLSGCFIFLEGGSPNAAVLQAARIACAV